MNNSFVKQLSLFFLFFICSFYVQADSITLRDKIGQMLIIGFDGKEINPNSFIAKAIERNNLGGVILFDFNQQSQQFDKNIASPEQVKELNQKLQEITQKANHLHHRPQLSLLISVDYEGGKVNRLHPRYGFPNLPTPKEVGQQSFSYTKHVANVMANTLYSAGFNLDFFPNLDVEINRDNPIIAQLERSFSSAPEEVTQYADIYSKQFLKHHIQCSYKHFPGHGSSISDSHLGFVDVTDTWSTQELIPYLQLLSQPIHCGSVMVGHIVNRNLDPTGLPASLSYAMITGLLRHDLQFDGVVITDDLQMKAITDYYGLKKALTLSINAGADMLIFGNQLSLKMQNPEELIDIIEQKVQSGEIPQQRIDEAYRRIITLKRSLINQ